MNCELEGKIFNVLPGNFEGLALQMFRLQYQHNELYRRFVQTLRIDPQRVDNLTSIPFLPVSFFKGHDITTGIFQPEIVFESSGTSDTGNSRHLIRSMALYRKSFTKTFEHFYGRVAGWCVVGLLPSYLERQHSSLVMMVNDLIAQSNHVDSAFYLYDYAELAAVIRRNERAAQKTLLIGVTFALLEFARLFTDPLHHTVVMETGGMKGRRKELVREEVHCILQNAWQLGSIHSEYGMTELLSQAYSPANGRFHCPAWMKVILREEDDPFNKHLAAEDQVRQGLINVVDLANIHSCAFIATDDLGSLYPDGSFEMSGRMDSSDMRGCSLLYA